MRKRGSEKGGHETLSLSTNARAYGSLKAKRVNEKKRRRVDLAM